MRFWDTSALVPLFINEPQTRNVSRWLRDDPDVVVWIVTRLELLSAIARRRREQPRSDRVWRRARLPVVEASDSWSQVTDLDLARRHAERVIETHPLRAAAAL